MKYWIITLTLLMAIPFTVCACSHETDEPEITAKPAPAPEPTPEPEPDPEPEGGKVLVAYFSCTNTTKSVAENIAGITDGNLFRIEPQQPYTSADLNYNTDCRANREQNDPSARPAIKGMPENPDEYQIVFIGYPIWWGKAPRVISTFLESGDFSGKTIVPFCTSHSSGLGSSGTDLHPLANDAAWKPGKRFGAGTTKPEIERWIKSLGIDFE